ncbi:MAG: P-loop NTPase fold protein, partial [Bacteriovorax sp.]
LITGLWGTGKTWFIRDVLDNLRQSDQESLYVSLYGVRSVEDIESEFFRQLHPFLAHKGIKLLGKLTKGLLKTAINFDIDDDSKSDGSVTFGVPSDKLIESVKIAENKILVFDDLERCAIPICDLLGYINQFVEHEGFKAILIANETEIIKRDENNETVLNAYKRIKEKLVGRTFEVLPELAPALQQFINQLQSDAGKEAGKDNQSLIAQIYETSEYKNLRVLRHALWDFDRLLSGLNSKLSANKLLVSDLLALFLVYAFEIKSGNINSNEIARINNGPYGHYFNTDNKNGEPDPDQKFKDIRLKYSYINLNEPLLEVTIWQDIFTSGIIPLAEIEGALQNSKYFLSDEQPSWVRLWNWRDLTDAEFKTTLSKVEREWNQFQYYEIGVVMHVAGILFWLFSIGFYKKDHNEVLACAKQHVDKLKKQGKLLNKFTLSLFLEQDSWGGLEFHFNKEKPFTELREYVSKKKNEALIESYDGKAKELVQLMKDDTSEFLRQLTLSNYYSSKFHDIPILTYIPEYNFFKAFLSLNPDQRRKISWVFAERYKHEHINPNLISELEWLKKIEQLFQHEVENRVGKISAYTIGEVINPSLTDAIAKLSSLQAIN